MLSVFFFFPSKQYTYMCTNFALSHATARLTSFSRFFFLFSFTVTLFGEWRWYQTKRHKRHYCVLRTSLRCHPAITELSIISIASWRNSQSTVRPVWTVMMVVGLKWKMIFNISNSRHSSIFPRFFFEPTIAKSLSSLLFFINFKSCFMSRKLIFFYNNFIPSILSFFSLLWIKTCWWDIFVLSPKLFFFK